MREVEKRGQGVLISCCAFQVFLYGFFCRDQGRFNAWKVSLEDFKQGAKRYPPPPCLSREISQNLLFKDASLGALLKSISHAGVGTLEGLISPQAGRVEH